MPGRSTQVAFRFSQELLARIDAFAAQLTEQTPGLAINRADAVKVLLEKALRAEGVKPAASKKKRKA